MNQSLAVLLLKFIYSEKATKFCEIFPLLLTTVRYIQSKVGKGKISQNCVAFSEYMNFKEYDTKLLLSFKVQIFREVQSLKI
jgi:hypothetical protein